MKPLTRIFIKCFKQLRAQYDIIEANNIIAHCKYINFFNANTNQNNLAFATAKCWWSTHVNQQMESVKIKLENMCQWKEAIECEDNLMWNPVLSIIFSIISHWVIQFNILLINESINCFENQLTSRMTHGKMIFDGFSEYRILGKCFLCVSMPRYVGVPMYVYLYWDLSCESCRDDRQMDFAEQIESVAYVICGENKRVSFKNFRDIWHTRGVSIVVSTMLGIYCDPFPNSPTRSSISYTAWLSWMEAIWFPPTR